MRERQRPRRLRAKYRDLSLGLLHSNAVAQASEDVDFGALSRPKPSCIGREWYPVTVVDGKSVSLGHDADDGVDRVAEPQLPPQHRRVTAESRVPHVVTDDHDRRGTGALVGGDNRASDGRLHTGDAETIRRDLGDLNGLDGLYGTAGNGHVARDGSERADLPDRLHLAPPRHEIVHRPP